MKFGTSSLDAQHELAHESLGTLTSRYLVLDDYLNDDFYFYLYDYFFDN